MNHRFIVTLLLSFFCIPLFGQHPLLQSGPMLGYAEMREALLWVQTKAPAEVQFAYWELEAPTDTLLTAATTTQVESAFTAKLIANQVSPGKQYGYQLRIDGAPVSLPYPTVFRTQPLWQWRNDPPPFTVALGSCFYVNETEYDRPGNAYGGQYQIMTAIVEKDPDVMLWLGDNVYLREADWYSRTGFYHRYTHTRSLPELQPLLASAHHYAIWDDHDFGPNDSDRSFIHKELAVETFNHFWGNPTCGLPGQGGITSFFHWYDIDFFLLDNRYFRSPNELTGGRQTLLGENQLEWLIDALAASDAPFKMVCIGGQVLNTAEVYETYTNLQPAERNRLLQRIAEEDIKGVIFLTGDRHHSELSSYTNRAGNVVYDLTISPLTSGPNTNVTENNDLRVEGALVTQRNFGLLRISGPRTARKLDIEVFDAGGEVLWEYEIAAPGN